MEASVRPSGNDRSAREIASRDHLQKLGDRRRVVQHRRRPAARVVAVSLCVTEIETKHGAPPFCRDIIARPSLTRLPGRADV